MTPSVKSQTAMIDSGTSVKCSNKSPSNDSTMTMTFFSLFLSSFVAILAGIWTPPSIHLARELLAERRDPSTVLPHLPCTPSNLQHYLHARPVHGLHVVCLELLNLDIHGNQVTENSHIHRHGQLDQSNSLRLTFYQSSHAGPLRRRTTINGLKEGATKVANIQLSTFFHHLRTELELMPPGPTRQPWAIFSPLGERIVGPADSFDQPQSIMTRLASSEMILVVQGGSWIWPGVHQGFRRLIQVASNQSRSVVMETLSLQPLIVSIEGFLTHDECDYIAQKAEPNMRYSQVSLKDADKGKAATEWRTSQSTFLTSMDDPILREIDQRVASLTRIPQSHQEFVQVLRYGHTEKYDAHHDFFDPRAYRKDPKTLALIEGGRKNRFATVFWYLTDVNEGGETIFPRWGGASQPRNLSDCSVGLKVRPQKGKVIIFYSLDAAGQMDEYSLHGACPVGKDNVKWAANKWVWNAPMGYIRD